MGDKVRPIAPQAACAEGITASIVDPWKVATAESDRNLIAKVQHFLKVLVAVTIPVEAGRRLPDLPGAKALSFATQRLHDALSECFAPPGEARSGVKIIGLLTCTDFPLRACAMRPTDSEQALHREAAIMRALGATQFSTARWNEMQEVSPGANHMRWLPGDVISKEDVELIRSVPALLGVGAPNDVQAENRGVGASRSVPEMKASGSSKHGAIEKRSWIQPDLDLAVREYKARRAPTFSELVVAVQQGRKGAIQQAQRLFGRNAIAEALRVKSRTMVSNSLEWQAIADELRIPRGPKSSSKRKGKIGLDLALERHAIATGDPVTDSVERRETIRLVQRHLPGDQAEATIEKLARGAMTDDQAVELVDFLRQSRSE